MLFFVLDDQCGSAFTDEVLGRSEEFNSSSILFLIRSEQELIDVGHQARDTAAAWVWKICLSRLWTNFKCDVSKIIIVRENVTPDLVHYLCY